MLKIGPESHGKPLSVFWMHRAISHKITHTHRFNSHFQTYGPDLIWSGVTQGKLSRWNKTENSGGIQSRSSGFIISFKSSKLTVTGDWSVVTLLCWHPTFIVLGVKTVLGVPTETAQKKCNSTWYCSVQHMSRFDRRRGPTYPNLSDQSRLWRCLERIGAVTCPLTWNERVWL